MTKLDEETIRNAAKVCWMFKTDINFKIRYGLRLREEHFKAMERGENPQDYRAVWIKEAVRKLFKVLGENCVEFAATYPQDRLSAEDLKDIFATAHQMVEFQIKKK